MAKIVYFLILVTVYFILHFIWLFIWFDIQILYAVNTFVIPALAGGCNLVEWNSIHAPICHHVCQHCNAFKEYGYAVGGRWGGGSISVIGRKRAL